MIRTPMLLAAVLPLVMLACGKQKDAPESTQLTSGMFPPRQPSDHDINDAAYQLAASRIAPKGQVTDDLAVTTQNGIVTIRGTSRSPEEIAKITAAVSTISGVKGVDNKMVLER